MNNSHSPGSFRDNTRRRTQATGMAEAGSSGQQLKGHSAIFVAALRSRSSHAVLPLVLMLVLGRRAGEAK
ncbi:hypothetical protein TsFJ059_001124 [Trichoderma semiorbis]|uniref:Uncharacterized protein n=1 Tax=Trichoderma semiorbis TaxID=1491008 RepID=A0A9P8KXZ6_9HYPO|nr:hypothetical protein TsFJ059_001124 [Trichoderma semiorbis]